MVVKKLFFMTNTIIHLDGDALGNKYKTGTVFTTCVQANYPSLKETIFYYLLDGYELDEQPRFVAKWTLKPKQIK